MKSPKNINEQCIGPTLMASTCVMSRKTDFSEVKTVRDKLRLTTQ